MVSSFSEMVCYRYIIITMRDMCSKTPSPSSALYYEVLDLLILNGLNFCTGASLYSTLQININFNSLIRNIIGSRRKILIENLFIFKNED